MTKQELIKIITPHYNNYRKRKDAISGPEAIEIFWNVGKVISDYLNEHPGAPDALYRQIYGKSERSDNIAQKSYITRDFLGRAYRIKKYFNSKNEIKKLLPKLQRFRQFYQAMPFFDNPKYKLSGAEKDKLLQVLNSSKTNLQIMAYINKLQKEKIGISNPRTQRLQELSKEKKLFIDLYNFLYNSLKTKKYKEAIAELGTIKGSFISELSNNTGALSSDKLMIKEFDIPVDASGLWLKYATMVNMLAGKKDATERRRFRRLIPPEKMMRLSEMIYAMRSEEDFNKFRL